jgi:hypothetical protein
MHVFTYSHLHEYWMQQSWQVAKEKSSQTNLNNNHKIKMNLLLMVNKKLNVKWESRYTQGMSTWKLQASSFDLLAEAPSPVSNPILL